MIEKSRNDILKTMENSNKAVEKEREQFEKEQAKLAANG